MYPLIVEQAKSAFAAHHGCLALLDPERRVFTRAYTVGVPTETAGSTFQADGTRSGDVVRSGTPFVSENLGREPIPDEMDAGQYRILGPTALVPVRGERDIIGTLCVAHLRTSGTRAFTEADLRLLETMAEVAGIAIRRARLYQNLQEAYGQMIVALTQATEVRDSYTAGHSERIAALAERVARELGCSEQEVDEVRWGARVHDIGKFGVPDALLRKAASLTEEEWAVVRHHPVLGEKILSSLERLRGVAKIVRHHHERWDGTGYPDGLRGNAIPLGARILAVVDAYGAITETRPYRPALTRAEALVEIRRGSGSQFDPQVVEAFAGVVGSHDTPRT
jgi:putative nucleotidyltransferase with HDIG domain